MQIISQHPQKKVKEPKEACPPCPQFPQVWYHHPPGCCCCNCMPRPPRPRKRYYGPRGDSSSHTDIGALTKDFGRLNEMALLKLTMTAARGLADGPD